MATTKLTANTRAVLLNLMKTVVSCPAEAKAEASAYAKALPIVGKIVVAQFPANDMAVMLKYDYAHRDKCIRIQQADGSVVEFCFADEATAPLVPGRSGWGCHHRLFLCDDKQGKVIEAWADAKKAHDTALKQKRTDYEAFITSATTYEAVLEVWPEAKQVEDRIKVNLPAAVNPEMLARITADSTARMKSAK